MYEQIVTIVAIHRGDNLRSRKHLVFPWIEKAYDRRPAGCTVSGVATMEPLNVVAISSNQIFCGKVVVAIW